MFVTVKDYHVGRGPLREAAFCNESGPAFLFFYVCVFSGELQPLILSFFIREMEASMPPS